MDARPCIFCQIISGDSPARVLYRDELVTAFRDIHPIASTHILVVSNKHIDSVNQLEAGDETLAGHLILVAKEMARREGIAMSGYRLIINTGANAGQTVFHIHVHLIGGGLKRFVAQ